MDLNPDDLAARLHAEHARFLVWWCIDDGESETLRRARRSGIEHTWNGETWWEFKNLEGTWIVRLQPFPKREAGDVVCRPPENGQLQLL